MNFSAMLRANVVARQCSAINAIVGITGYVLIVSREMRLDKLNCSIPRSKENDAIVIFLKSSLKGRVIN